jgi:hypothetical protein
MSELKRTGRQGIARPHRHHPGITARNGRQNRDQLRMRKPDGQANSMICFPVTLSHEATRKPMRVLARSTSTGGLKT